VSNNHNAAEVVRLAESLRLVEQGRDEAIRGREAGLEQIKKLQEELALAHRTSEGYKATIADIRTEAYRLSAELDHANADKVQLQLLREEERDALRNEVRDTAIEGLIAAIVLPLLVGFASFFVGRWAR
jgi:ABC-type molybdate transport system ATPase subunit